MFKGIVALFSACANHAVSIKYLSGLPVETYVVQQSQTAVCECRMARPRISRKI